MQRLHCHRIKIQLNILKNNSYNNSACPYYYWYFMVSEQEPHYDPNVLDDIKHLIYLNEVDGIVSNEKGFMREASKTLFPNKDFLTLNQFIERLKQN
ncbi:hypothetical protein COY52_00160 [Candidatus Desantisbacteria bacterium CG_4_10_14_0_8_um_filter_48_22]|uniref:Uncharacterized protein n=1 Tax=Candidatus Desantisbacteria bacterium CG_4_10_14_0_8_um_filter_48_22 TaxID=1974543 RepID=A0A2M7SFM0_9BACT|nr:MAG: hypothetical protein COS16_09440 [Candidatus Desantisbacteria bacterium CG02_land_8_20_14_3_00_49_13]PIZ18300.1 MAG: hypothetical protein COY52_00160 [Candidatus Desantisbacteria bacterium CG_4_10_14_0_8_um_filter_48_22]